MILFALLFLFEFYIFFFKKIKKQKYDNIKTYSKNM